MPSFFHYVRDRDNWQWRLPNSRAISLAYWAIDKDFPSIAAFAQALDDADGVHRIVTEGEAMQRYANRLTVEQALRWRPGFIGGHSCLIVNATCLFSEVGDWLCHEFSQKPPGILFVAYYFDRDDGKRQWGLRGHGTIDLSIVAKGYGGGGHHDAAGFVTSQDWQGDVPVDYGAVYVGTAVAQ